MRFDSHWRRCARATVFLPVLAVLVSLGVTCDGNGLPGGSDLTITAVPSGCGVKVSDTRTLSWVIKFTASGGDPNAGYQWFFSDGSGASGQVVVHSFDTASAEAAASFNTEDHEPVDFDVTLTNGTDSITQSFGVPMRGETDGGPEPEGDECTVDDGRRHVANGTLICYNQNPPATGPHYSAAGVSPVSPGVYVEDIASTEQYVHNLEHGSVVLLYDCGGGDCSDDLITQLNDLFDALPESPRFNEKKLVISRYSGINSSCEGTSDFPSRGQFLMIAWGVQRYFESFDMDEMINFYRRHVDHGPEDAPIPAAIHDEGGG